MINSRPSSDAFNEENNNNDSTFGIHGLNNEDKIIIEEEAKDACVVSPREKSRCIDFGTAITWMTTTRTTTSYF